MVWSTRRDGLLSYSLIYKKRRVVELWIDVEEEMDRWVSLFVHTMLHVSLLFCKDLLEIDF